MKNKDGELVETEKEVKEVYTRASVLKMAGE